MTGILLLVYLYNPVPSLSRLPQQTYFYVFRCYTVQVSYRIQWSRVQKGCVTKHCDLGLSGCLQVWPGAGGITHASSMICTSWSIWHWPNKHRTNLRPHRPKWKEVCSTSHTRTERPTSGSGRGHKSDIISNVRKMKWSRAGHINRLKDDRWTSSVTTWRP